MTDKPDPNGDKPEGWDPLRWLAYQRIATRAHTYQEVGDMVGRSRATVAGWVRAWRVQYGADLFADPPGTRSLTSTQRAGALAGGRATQQRWADVRAAVATDLGAMADKARRLGEQILDDHLADTDEGRALRAELGPSDFLDLARGIDLMAKRADQLTGIPDATRAFTFQQNTVTVAAGTDDDRVALFDRLDAAAKESGTVEVLGQIETALGEYQKLKNGPETSGEEVIDIDQ